jgi:hypothetical protein
VTTEIVVTGEKDPAAEAAAVAGVAAGAAAAAGEKAEEAGTMAEDAQAQAQAAQAEAWDARQAVTALEEQVRSGFASIADSLAEMRQSPEPGPAPDGEAAPEPPGGGVQPPPPEGEPASPEKRDGPAGAQPATGGKRKRKLAWRSE